MMTTTAMLMEGCDGDGEWVDGGGYHGDGDADEESEKHRREGRHGWNGYTEWNGQMDRWRTEKERT